MSNLPGYGYSTRIVHLNKAASARGNMGVKLGRECIKRGIPVAVLSDYLGVSRQTIYNWFSGATSPTGETKAAIEGILKSNNALAKLER